jgi:hypothetical protein
MPKRKQPVRNQRPPTLLILAGIALLLIAVFALKNSYDTPVASLEARLDQALKDDRPAFVFVQQRKHPDRQLERARARHPHRF